MSKIATTCHISCIAITFITCKRTELCINVQQNLSTNCIFKCCKIWEKFSLNHLKMCLLWNWRWHVQTWAECQFASHCDNWRWICAQMSFNRELLDQKFSAKTDQGYQLVKLLLQKFASALNPLRSELTTFFGPISSCQWGLWGVKRVHLSNIR